MLVALQPDQVHGRLPSMPTHPYHPYYQTLRILRITCYKLSEEESNKKAEEWVRQNLSELLPTPPDYAAGEVLAYKAK
jgi:hypothetical protein